MNELNISNEPHNKETKNFEPRKPLVIFKTEADKRSRDIMEMSNFFDGYIQQMSLSLKESSKLEQITTLPFSDLGIINDVLQQADIIMKGNITLLPDFDNLPIDIREKMKKGIYKIGESKQANGNLRAVILDENGVRVKDITLKKSLTNPDNIETTRSIANQLQMRQIYFKLVEIQEFQTYQIEKDRDRDIIIPFLDARTLILEAEVKDNEEERIQLLKEADRKIGTALNAIYADIETTSKRFSKQTNLPFIQFGNTINSYMSYLTSDMQIATKYAGIRMQLLEFLGESKTAKVVLQQFQHVIYDFLTKPITRQGLSTSDLLHNYFPYDKSNMNCWYNFSSEMKPVLESGIKMLDLSLDDSYNNDVYIVSMEDIYEED